MADKIMDHAEESVVKMYRVTRLFIGGLLEGITHVEETYWAPPVGFECLNPYGGTSPYRIVSVEEV